jgi:hypothetical protein
LDKNDQPGGVMVFVIEVTGMVKIQQDQLALNEELTNANEGLSAVNNDLTTA